MPLDASPLPTITVPRLPSELVGFSPSTTTVVMQGSLDARIALCGPTGSPTAPVVSSYVLTVLFFVDLSVSPEYKIAVANVLYSLDGIVLSSVVLDTSTSVAENVSTIFDAISAGVLTLSSFREPKPVAATSTRSDSISDTLTSTVSMRDDTSNGTR